MFGSDGGPVRVPAASPSPGVTSRLLCVVQVVLKGNISVLLEDVEQLRQREANLTAELRLQEGNVPP